MKLKPIIPSVYGLDFHSYMRQIIDIIKSNQISLIHFDGINDLELFTNVMIKYGCSADIHLISDTPLFDLQKILDINLPDFSRVSMHIETRAKHTEFITLSKSKNISPGLALKLGTSIPLDIDYLKQFSYFHFICNDDENGLVAFQNQVFKKIDQLIALLGKDVSITIDSGVKTEHVGPAIGKNVSNIVMGSAIFNSENPLEVLKTLNKIAGN